jgi:hypothetical protein
MIAAVLLTLPRCARNDELQRVNLCYKSILGFLVGPPYGRKCLLPQTLEDLDKYKNS